jgi:hypothetical protein
MHLADERMRHARLCGAVQRIEDLTRLDPDRRADLVAVWPAL